MLPKKMKRNDFQENKNMKLKIVALLAMLSFILSIQASSSSESDDAIAVGPYWLISNSVQEAEEGLSLCAKKLESLETNKNYVRSSSKYYQLSRKAFALQRQMQTSTQSSQTCMLKSLCDSLEKQMDALDTQGRKEWCKSADFKNKLRDFREAQAIYWHAKYQEQAEVLQAKQTQLHKIQADLELLRTLHRRPINPETKKISATLDVEKFKELAQGRKSDKSS